MSVTARKGNAALMAMRWRDSKDVFLLTTETNADKVECSAQRGRLKVQKPAPIPLYNKYMGGVDLHDYLETKYSPCRATRKMWRKFALHLISTAATNAYIIYGLVKKNLKVKNSVHFAFREALGNKMLTMNDSPPSRGVAPVTPRYAVNINHLPARYPPVASAAARAATDPDAYVPPQQHRCQMPGCKLRSFFYCRECNKCFCIKQRNMCFSEYHQQLAVTPTAIDAPVAAAPSTVTTDAGASSDTSVASSHGDGLPVVRM